MFCQKSWLAVILSLFVSGLVPWPALAASTGSGVTAVLVTGNDGIRPGQPFTVGIHLRLPAGAHIYWLNPGDAGLATRVAWTLPAGFTAGPLRWPAPERIVDPPLVSLGYQNETVLFTEITPPANLTEGGLVQLKARVDWLVCHDSCIPGGTEVERTLPVLAIPGRPTAAAPLLAKFQKQLPAALTGWRFRVVDQGSQMIIYAYPGADSINISLDEYIFIPCQEDLVDGIAEQLWQKTATGSMVKLQKTPARRKLTAGDKLPGILLRTAPGGNNAPSAWEITLECNNKDKDN
jgi:thiol:disulfide interchange protein DsbD